jgi:hypothetical protein
MNIFLDVELTDFCGDVLSVGMVSSCGKEFYAECDQPNVCEWVMKNVIPKMSGVKVSQFQMSKQIGKYLSQFDSVTIICDWPDDIRAFTSLMVEHSYLLISHNDLSFRIVEKIAMPDNKDSHNALYDAKQLKHWIEPQQ